MKLTKLFAAVIVGGIVILFMGCASTNSLKKIDAYSGWLNPAVTAELEVSSKKAVGVAEGHRRQLQSIKQTAMLDALIKHNDGKLDGEIADLIVEPLYSYNYKIKNVTVTVVGYPAKYKDFKSVDYKTLIDHTVMLKTEKEEESGVKGLFKKLRRRK